jgi:hypothetical protein
MRSWGLDGTRVGRNNSPPVPPQVEQLAWMKGGCSVVYSTENRCQVRLHVHKAMERQKPPDDFRHYRDKAR